MQDDDRFGVCDAALSAAQKAHGSSQTVRCGGYVPTRAEVRSMAPESLRPLLIEWMWESPSELIPTDEQIHDVKAVLEARPDADLLAGLIEECRQYIEG